MKPQCLVLLVFATALCPAQFATAEGFASATYDPASGNVTVQVEGATAWFLGSQSGLLTGPEDVEISGVLPSMPQGTLVTNTSRNIGETFFGGTLTYGPISLGRVAQPNIPFGDLVISCSCPFNAPEKRFQVRYIPESSSLTLSLVSISCIVVRIRRA
jgi:hypothetical protein